MKQYESDELSRIVLVLSPPAPPRISPPVPLVLTISLTAPQALLAEVHDASRFLRLPLLVSLTAVTVVSEWRALLNISDFTFLGKRMEVYVY